MPDEGYLSTPSADVGAEVRKNRALNCCPWVRSLTQWPEAMIHSPAEMTAAWPTTVTTSHVRAPWRAGRRNRSRRCGRLLARRELPAPPRYPAADSCGSSRFEIHPWRPSAYPGQMQREGLLLRLWFEIQGARRHLMTHE